MNAALGVVRPGVTDAEVARIALGAMIDCGGEWVANWPHIRTGRHSGLAHRTWQNAGVRRSQPTVLELCGVLGRYHSPLYRTVIFDATPEQRSIASAVRAALAAGRAALMPGATTGAIFANIERVVKEHGHGDLIASRNGYMVG